LFEEVAKFPNIVLFFASSSEVFAPSPKVLHESSSLGPVNPYGISKLAGQELVKFYRETQSLPWCSGIMFNHTSGLSSPKFVCRKIISGLLHFFYTGEKLKLGNLYSVRDLGYAKDYMQAAYAMTTVPCPSDYVISSEKLISVRELVECGLSYYNAKFGNSYILEEVVESDPSLFVTDLVHPRVGSSTCIRFVLNWSPTISIEQLLPIMAEEEISGESC
jgi:GDP-mannose 4,6-dehydratase